MPSSKTRRPLEKQPPVAGEPLPERTLTKIKFNISVDSLRPFVETDAHPTSRRRPAFSETSPKTARKRTARHTEPEDAASRQARSPDVAREVSNEILQKIEARGVGCLWEEGEEEAARGEWEQAYDGAVWLPGEQQQSQGKQWGGEQLGSTSALSLYLCYFEYCERARQLQPLYYEIDAGGLWTDPRTTLMIKNIPNKYTIQLLAEEIDREHANAYDFLYLPCDIKNNCNVGYGFVNFLHLHALQRFYERFQGKRWGKFKSEKICTLTYARLQGLHSLIEHFQNSKVLNHKDKKYQPIIRHFPDLAPLLQKQRSLLP